MGFSRNYDVILVDYQPHPHPAYSACTKESLANLGCLSHPGIWLADGMVYGDSVLQSPLSTSGNARGGPENRGVDKFVTVGGGGGGGRVLI